MKTDIKKKKKKSMHSVQNNHCFKLQTSCLSLYENMFYSSSFYTIMFFVFEWHKLVFRVQGGAWLLCCVSLPRDRLSAELSFPFLQKIPELITHMTEPYYQPTFSFEGNQNQKQMFASCRPIWIKSVHW